MCDLRRENTLYMYMLRSKIVYPVADLGEGPAPPPLFWVKKEEMAEGEMADRASKSRLAPPVSSRSGSATGIHYISAYPPQSTLGLFLEEGWSSPLRIRVSTSNYMYTWITPRGGLVLATSYPCIHTLQGSTFEVAGYSAVNPLIFMNFWYHCLSFIDFYRIL